MVRDLQRSAEAPPTLPAPAAFRGPPSATSKGPRGRSHPHRADVGGDRRVAADLNAGGASQRNGLAMLLTGAKVTKDLASGRWAKLPGGPFKSKLTPSSAALGAPRHLAPSPTRFPRRAHGEHVRRGWSPGWNVLASRIGTHGSTRPIADATDSREETSRAAEDSPERGLGER